MYLPATTATPPSSGGALGALDFLRIHVRVFKSNTSQLPILSKSTFFLATPESTSIFILVTSSSSNEQ
jgi:hypothetical protein